MVLFAIKLLSVYISKNWVLVVLGLFMNATKQANMQAINEQTGVSRTGR